MSANDFERTLLPMTDKTTEQGHAVCAAGDTDNDPAGNAEVIERRGENLLEKNGIKDLRTQCNT